MKIYTSKGLYTEVDDEDASVAKMFSWYAQKNGNTYYAITRPRINGVKKIINLHHMLVGYPLGKYEVDHIDGDGLNNKRDNLRVITRRQNSHNMHVNKSSIYPGVHQVKSGEYKTHIDVNGVRKHLGYFKREVDAFAAYLIALNDIGEPMSVSELKRLGFIDESCDCSKITSLAR